VSLSACNYRSIYENDQCIALSSLPDRVYVWSTFARFVRFNAAIRQLACSFDFHLSLPLFVCLRTSRALESDLWILALLLDSICKYLIVYHYVFNRLHSISMRNSFLRVASDLSADELTLTTTIALVRSCDVIDLPIGPHIIIID